jgi:Leucine-rich repeat (LRR) protein
MATISTEIIVASTPHILPGKAESTAHFLGRVSHLNLQHRGFASLSGVETCTNLRALYAYDNRISSIPPGLCAIEVLVLDGNRISEISCLEQSHRLRKLHLDRNQLSRVDGLTSCGRLEELHVAHQRGLSAPLEMDPRSILSIARSVRWIDVSGCGLPTLRSLSPCAQLTRLDAADNALSDLSEVLALLHGSWTHMERVRVVLMRGEGEQ